MAVTFGRLPGEIIVIDVPGYPVIEVKIVGNKKGTIHVSVDAPRCIRVDRKEVYDRRMSEDSKKDGSENGQSSCG